MGNVSAGRITITLNAGTEKFNADYDNARAKLRAFGEAGAQAHRQLSAASAHTVSDVQATSAALRTLEGGINNNLRAAERFLATTLGLGATLQKAFPVFGALALVGVVGELYEHVNKVRDALNKLQTLPATLAAEFGKINASLQTSTDQLLLATVKAENELAKLNGKHENGLAETLAQARLEADKLGETLNADIEKQAKLLKEQQVSAMASFFTGQAETGHVGEYLKDFQAKLNSDVLLPGNARVQAAQTEADKNKAMQDLNTEVMRAYGKAISETNQELISKQAEQAVHERQTHPHSFGEGLNSGLNELVFPTQDHKTEIKALTLRMQSLQMDADQAAAYGSAWKAQDQLSTAQIAHQNGKTDRKNDENPLADKLREINEKLQGTKSEIDALGKDPAVESALMAIAKGYQQAAHDIDEVNRKLKSEGKPALNTAGSNSIVVGDVSASLDELKLHNLEKAEKVFHDMKDGAQRLAEAIDQDSTAADRLRAKIAEINAGKAAAAKGPEAVWQASYDAMPTATEEDRAKKDEAFAVHQRQLTDTIDGIKRQIAATEELTKAEDQGLAMQRQAALTNISRSGESADTIAEKIADQKAKWALEDSQTMRGASGSDGASRYFHEMVDNAQSAGQQVHQILTESFEGVNDSLIGMITGQKNSWAKLFESLSASLAKMGLQTAEAQAAQAIGNHGNQSGSGPWSEKPPSGIGGLFTGLFGGGKRDGSSQGTALYVQMAGLSNLGGSSSGLPDFGAPAGLLDKDDLSALGDFNPSELTQLANGPGNDNGEGGGSGAGMGLLKGVGGFLLKLFGGFRAEGGDVDPGHAYVVGEQGPEVWTPPSKGTITPNHKLGGSTAYYTIDARGANEADVEMRVNRAIKQAHGSAVRQSMATMQENRARRPRSKG